MNAVAYYVALPALIFVSTYDQSVGDLLSPVLVAGLPIVVLATTALAGFDVFRPPRVLFRRWMDDTTMSRGEFPSGAVRGETVGSESPSERPEPQRTTSSRPYRRGVPA